MGLIGTTLAGRYQLLGRLGAGGMGEVYRARDKELDELVALKIIRYDAENEAALDRFRREVKLARRVTHANVARTYELGTSDGVMYCTMELVEGETLFHRMQRGAVPLAEAIAVASAVCDALVAAHAAGVIHRDIKPANILLGDGGRVVLADFGIALAAAAADHAGTPAYMAPEQARGEPATPAADVYAVGVVLYELVTGERAFTGTLVETLEAKQTRTQLVALIAPPELAGVIARATARELGTRYATAGELRRALAAWAPIAAPTLPAAPRAVRPAIDERTVFVVAPSGTVGPELDVAEEIHEELLAVLARGAGIHLVPRVDLADCERGTIVRFALTPSSGESSGSRAASLALIATRAGEPAPAAIVHLPLSIEQVPRSVALAAATVTALVDAPPPAEPRSRAAAELLLRARHLARTTPRYDAEPLALVERAHALDPEDVATRATLAIQLVRSAFFTHDGVNAGATELVARAREHVRVAFANGAHLAETHLAAAHLELHTGTAAVAASHYRTAIAIAPYSAEAHDYLGRLLLEAGYLDAGRARLATATAISPQFHSAHWEIARTFALEGHWSEFDRVVAEAHLEMGPIASARYAWWRGNFDVLRAIRAHDLSASRVGDAMFGALVGVFLDDAWPQYRDALIARVLGDTSPSRRRSTLVAQIAAETAGYAGDLAVCIQLLDHALARGLFDLHWYDKCPMLAVARESPAHDRLRRAIAERANAIYDALYGDGALGATQAATS